MSISGYEFLSIVQIKSKSNIIAEDKGAEYMTILENVRSAIAQNHAQELAAALDDESAAKTLRGLIMKYRIANGEKFTVPENLFTRIELENEQ